MNKRDIQKRYKVPKGASPEEARRINRNRTAAIWRLNNREKVRESAKKYREKAKEAKDIGREIIGGEDRRKIDRPGKAPVSVTPLTDGPQLFFEALSYGSEADKLVMAAYREAEFSGRKVVGIIKDFDGKLLGPYFTEQAFTAAIRDLYQDASKRQKAAGYDTVKNADGTTSRKSKYYPTILASSSDDGNTVYITVEAS